MTFKQLEALYWVAHLGNFSLAARELHTTQSAVSKRIQELEATLGVALFDRSQRSSMLTEKGAEVAQIAKQLLDQRSAAIEKLMHAQDVTRRLTLGVTELTAMTWLPTWVRQIRDCYPRIAIEPYVDNSANLWAKMQRDELDLIIAPEAAIAGNLHQQVVGRVESCWMCQPGLVPFKQRLRLRDIADQRLIVQGSNSGTGLIYDAWLHKAGVVPVGAIVVSNLLALIGLTVAGLGISYLPKDCLQPMLDQGRLQMLPVSPGLPAVTYSAYYKGERTDTLVASIVEIARDCCDFRSMFQMTV